MSGSELRLFDRVTVHEEIGRGGYGVVYRVTLEDDGVTQKEAAGKQLHEDLFNDGETFDEFRRECHLLKKLQHDNIVKIYGIYQPPTSRVPMLIMEKMRMSLHQWIKDKAHPMTDSDKFRVLREVVEGLAYIHSRNQVHRDLTAKNILISQEPNATAKIADFGVAKIIDRESTATHTRCPGTPCYMPPEATGRHPKYGSSLDIYSFGVLMVYVFTGHLPKMQPRRKLKKIRDHSKPEINKYFMLVERCLARIPQLRPTCDVIQLALTGRMEPLTQYSWEYKNECVPGLNVEGICSENECIRYGKEVICDIPLDHFDLAKHAPDAKCPHCDCHIEPITFIFCQCKWVAKGKKFMRFSQPPELYNDGGTVTDEDPPKRIPLNQGGNWLQLTFDIETI